METYHRTLINSNLKWKCHVSQTYLLKPMIKLLWQKNQSRCSMWSVELTMVLQHTSNAIWYAAAGVVLIILCTSCIGEPLEVCFWILNFTDAEVHKLLLMWRISWAKGRFTVGPSPKSKSLWGQSGQSRPLRAWKLGFIISHMVPSPKVDATREPEEVLQLPPTWHFVFEKSPFLCLSP